MRRGSDEGGRHTDGHVNIRQVAAIAASALIVAACTTAGDGGEAAGDASDAAATGQQAAATSASEVATATADVPERQQILNAYRSYTRLASEALARGDVDIEGLAQVTTAAAMRALRARIRANAEDGITADGRLVPSATDTDVRWDGGDTARVSDCVLNGLSHVATGDGDARVVEEATGTRRPVAATLRRVDGRWLVARADMVQDDESDNPQQDPPFLRGPMPDGPPSCAPPDIEREVLAGYRSFWDAFDRAFGFGRDGPANPDDPALSATSVEPQLTEAQKFLGRVRDQNQTSVGMRDSREPWLVAVTEFDSVAFVNACVRLAESRTVDRDTGEVMSRNQAGRIDYEEVRMVAVGRQWKVSNWATLAKDISQCEPSE